MNKLILTMCCYNDIGSLKLCFPSISYIVDGCIVVDGAWKEYPTKNAHSTDGSPEYIEEQMKNKFFMLIQPKERLTAIDSMNLYMESLDKEFDSEKTWRIAWDCDWELLPTADPNNKYTVKDVEQEWNDLKEGKMDKYNLLYIKMKGWRPDRDAVPEVFFAHKGTSGARYAITHYSLFRKEIEIRSFPHLYPKYTLQTCMVDHRFMERPKGRILNQNEYYKTRTEWVPKSAELPGNYPLQIDKGANIGYDMDILFVEEPNKKLEDLVDIYGHNSEKCKLCTVWNYRASERNKAQGWMAHYKQEHPEEYKKMMVKYNENKT